MGGGGGGSKLPEPVAMDFPVIAGACEGSSPPVRVPRRIRRRLLKGRSSSSPTSVEEIEAKLREADLRRQQFHEWLSFKARHKPRSPSWSSQEEDLGRRLEAKLVAAEQKRLSLLVKAQKRLAMLDELRQAAKSGVEMRCVKEREELGTRVESRVRQAEANRMRLLNAHMQRRAALKERTARYLMQRAAYESKYKERVCSAILQKRAAAEMKRLGLLEAEKRRARARVLQVQRVVKSVCSQREFERRKLKEQLEDRLQRAKQQRAEYLRQKGSPPGSARTNLSKHGDFLSRKLARCWRRFVRCEKTTLALTRAFEVLGLNEKSVKSMPFEQLALCIESPATLQTTKALLDRLENRFLLSQLSSSSTPENIDHLLKHLASPKRRVSSARTARTRGVSKKGGKSSETNKSSRYSLRVVLCAYMILAHPNAVFSGQGERETLLMGAAVNFVREFELLVKIILNGPDSAHTSRQSSPDVMSPGLPEYHESSSGVVSPKKFRSQLAAFDRAWCSYLYRFVVWKVKDARSLEEDLVRAACKMELSMMKTCKLTAEGQSCNLSHDMKAIQKQVTEDQKLLREKVQHLSGDAGIERMESALSDTRSKFFEAKENGSPLATPVANISSPLDTSTSGQPSVSAIGEHSNVNTEKPRHVVRSLFEAASLPSENGAGVKTMDVPSSSTTTEKPPTENEILVNEILHGCHDIFADNDVDSGSAEMDIEAKVRDTMKKAFWDGVIDSMRGDKPDYSRILGLVMEVRDELCELAPKAWKEEILNSIDLDILSQLLKSGFEDTDYLGQVLQYSLAMLQKLSAPAKEDEMKKGHEKLLSELAEISKSSDKGHSSFIIAVVKGLRFILEEIQTLKTEVSKARMQMLKPIIKDSAGLEYLQKAFADRYGPPSNAAVSLPLTVQWMSSVRNLMEEEWSEHVDSLAVLPAEHAQPLVTTLRAGNGVSGRQTSPAYASGSSELPECKGEKLDMLLRLWLLQLAGGVEGLTAESVPETFKLNTLRLRSVQSQYQQVIVIATSMLVLRQVLGSENPKISPSELETAISELVRKLTKLLDNVADCGVEEIMEAMLSSSGACDSDMNLRSRKQIMMRVLIKSLQNGDQVFNKVSKSIYSAFRGVVLGGSGAKGKKLADAALRRIGASTLMDRVVKAAEMLITMATISEWVHGSWYKCLL